MSNREVDIANEAIKAIGFNGEVKEINPFGAGMINDTFLVVCDLGENKEERYILQRINHLIFKEIDKLMKNYCNICNYLKEIVKRNNGDVNRETITVVNSKDGNSYVQDSKGNYWRAIKYIDDTITYNTISCSEDFYKTGKAFGKFQSMLSEYDATKLYESIPNFHNTKERYKTFLASVEKDAVGRCKSVQKEIDFIIEREKDTRLLLDKLESGQLPLRVTHNDTKLSNVLMDKDTKEGICVVDLDTIMPGLVGYDFGDAIRTGATFAAEDEKDLDKVYIDFELYEAFTKGFIEGTGSKLTREELRLLPMGAKVITLEQGIRFLTDYLDGDVYYKTNYANHNLDRTRTQLKLVKDTEEKWDQLNNIVNKYI